MFISNFEEVTQSRTTSRVIEFRRPKLDSVSLSSPNINERAMAYSSDKSPEFTARSIRQWLKDLEVKTLYTESRSLWGRMDTLNRSTGN
jgi:hypothetical protein